MSAPIAYLDSSAIIKRYIEEPGSAVVRDHYLKAHAGKTIIACSLWNIGEVLGALDRARRLGRIDGSEYNIVKKRFLWETRRLLKLGALLVIPAKIAILKNAWRMIEKHHIYLADALQIASAKYVSSNKFLTGDKKLHESAVIEGLDSVILT